MTTAEDLFRAGDVKGCLAELQSEVRKRPADPKLRIFLAQLLMVTGDWDRAVNQLGVSAELDASALPMKHTYTAAIQCEKLRAAVFAGERSPLVLGDPPPWIALLLQALVSSGQGRSQEAVELRARAMEDAETTPGTLNGSPFEWLADADSRLGPVLEVLLNGAYYWVPVARIRRIEFEKPEDVRDLVWLPAQFTWTNDGQAMGLVPVRYPGTEQAAEDVLRLSRKTQWDELGDGAFAGLGQRILTTSAEELGLLEIRTIDMSTQPALDD
jgi:type VI secretion system protein ImpE